MCRDYQKDIEFYTEERMMGIIFGPVASRRFGKSLGIDLSPYEKVCNYDCLYCELSSTPMDGMEERRFVEVDEVMEALEKSLSEYRDIDILTVTANGEPTLYPDLEKLVVEIKRRYPDMPVLILSNGSKVGDESIRRALSRFDMVKLSMDCATAGCFKKLDRPTEEVDIDDIKRGMIRFAREYDGELIVEILVVAGLNDKESEMDELNRFLLDVSPDRIDIGTLDRPPAYDVKAVGYSRLRELSMRFDPSLHVHITSRKDITDIEPSRYSESEILDTISRRPLTPDDVELLMDADSRKRLEKLLDDGEIEKKSVNGIIFFKKSENSLDK
jgi:wyosine [tRNA(Phe)-imidazoG37] synthetase (radical SAM superfamily)